MAEKMKRLVLMFDGTWNDHSDGTNVYRMQEAIDVGPVGDGVKQLVKYLPGVGTGWTGQILGGGFGLGLSTIVKEGYAWLSENYKDGDEIFVFGFSRGAYSARSFVSFVHRCGVLKTDALVEAQTRALVEEAFELYRAKDSKERDAKSKAFAAKNCRAARARVKMVGVWDTVGALGIPDSVFKSNTPLIGPLLTTLGNTFMARKEYVFHDQGLPCIVEKAYHALAIDEHRKDFEPTLWDNKKAKEQVVEQCWFVGSHCNVGGGKIDQDKDGKNDDLWQLSYEWMQDKAIAAGLRFKWTYRAGDQWPHWLTITENSYQAMLNGGYALISWEHTRPIGKSFAESLHWSVLQRLKNNSKYIPAGLVNIGDIHSEDYKLPYKPLPVVPCCCKNYSTDKKDL